MTKAPKPFTTIKEYYWFLLEIFNETFILMHKVLCGIVMQYLVLKKSLDYTIN